MKLKDIIDSLDLTVVSGESRLDNEVNAGYVSDLMSDVIAHTSEGNIWITLQVHVNIVAVASMKGLAGVILINGRKPEDETLRKAKTENIPVLLSELPAFEVVGRLYGLGIPGMSNA
jgi:predicted transcriptional regulator